MEADDSLFTFLSVRSVLGRTFRIYFSRWPLFSLLALIIVITDIILFATVQKNLVLEDPEAYIRYAAVYTITFEIKSPLQSIATIFLVQFAFFFCTIIQAAIIQIVAEYYTQKRSTLRGSLVHTFDRFRALFGFALLYTVVFFLLGLVALALVYLYGFHAPKILLALIAVAVVVIVVSFLLSMAIALPVLVMEKQSPIGALKRSFELLRSHRCYVFCSGFLLAIVLYFGSNIYHGIVSLFGFSTVTFVVNELAAVVTFPLQTITAAVLYFSIRVQQDGLNMETLLIELETNGDGTYNNVRVVEDDGEVV